MTKFSNAVTLGDLEKVKSLLQQGVSLKDIKEMNAQTPLHICAYENHLEMLNFFLNLNDESIGKINLESRDKTGWTALHRGAAAGYLEVCETLLKAGADPTAINLDRNLPLHYLARRCIETEKKKMKRSSSHVVEESNYARVIKLMLEKGTDINFQNEQGDTPLHQAVSSGNEEGIRILLRHKARTNVRNKNLVTPLMLAEMEGQQKAIQLLFEAESKKKHASPLISYEVHPDDHVSVGRIMRDPESGVGVKYRKGIFMSHKRTFVAEEAIDWIMTNLGRHSREDTRKICQNLLDNHIITPTNRGIRVFKDSKDLFQFSYVGDISEKPHETEAQVVSLDHFEILRILGKGLFGTVVLSRKKDNHKLYAMKIMNKSLLKEEGEMEALMTEKKILQNDCPFLVQLHFSFQNKKHFFLVMDYVGGGDLAGHIKREERFHERKAQFVAAELVLCLEYLHSRVLFTEISVLKTYYSIRKAIFVLRILE
eukprot:TRINITY_DN6948_c0_g1_i1.p1 TRINITY_DN6948_c0_g1~~TRINITY_DN6948_c0_g1_i1.p1  ORF type:complete len:499 (+),score=115.77 TRINITY_DN6948_c0_g1_i1:50-1498(+)